MKTKIIRCWMTGSSSTTLVIPRDFARKYKIDKACHLVIEETKDGILIRKLDLDKAK